MPVEEARKVKFRRGQLEHGVEFTADPLEEMFAEFLDVANYAEVAVAKGRNRAVMDAIREHALATAALVQQLALESTEAEPVGYCRCIPVHQIIEVPWDDDACTPPVAQCPTCHLMIRLVDFVNISEIGDKKARFLRIAPETSLVL